MNIGFYAPLKAPDHPIPSGDREMARNLVKVMSGLGHRVDIVCKLRSYDRSGDATRQARLQNLATQAVRRILRRQPAIDLMFTYHPYYKAPDWIGPQLAKALSIPYVIAEASVANKRATGRWSIGHQATVDAVRSADLVLAFTRVDSVSLAACRGERPGLTLFPPFIATLPSTPANNSHPKRPRLIAVGMMRSDVKLDSYRLLAAALRIIRDQHWELVIAGDGPGAECVQTAFADFADRVTFLGCLNRDQLADLYRTGDIFVWPGIGEAYGLAYLEAQAHGLPIVAVSNGGVGDVVSDGYSGILCASADASHYAQAIGDLLTNVERRKAMGRNAIHYVNKHHSMAMASESLGHLLRGLVVP